MNKNINDFTYELRKIFYPLIREIQNQNQDEYLKSKFANVQTATATAVCMEEIKYANNTARLAYLSNDFENLLKELVANNERI